MALAKLTTYRHGANAGYNLVTELPELAKEWHPDKNPLPPEYFPPTSQEVVWWQCSEGHSYKAPIHQRATNNRHCPKCYSKAASPQNNLLVKAPELAAEWHPTRNKHKPSYYRPNSVTEVWWQCEHGHSFKERIDIRNSFNKGCPHCYSRGASATKNLAVCRPDLAKEWHPTKNKKPPTYYTQNSKEEVYWLCQHGAEFKMSIHDRSKTFYCCDEHKLNKVSEDEKLSKYWDVKENKKLGLNPDELYINSGKQAAWKCERGHTWTQKICDVARTYNKSPCRSCNSFIFTAPELVEQLHPIKNSKIDLLKLTKTSTKKLWWQCENGHDTYRAVLHQYKAKGCKSCRALPYAFPKLAKEWHPTKNKGINIEKVLPADTRKVWWQCEHGHEWQVTVCYRTGYDTGCPVCSRAEIREKRHGLSVV